ncbi:MAG: DUF3592 domain-containing protein [Planctomycetota bacterium]
MYRSFSTIVALFMIFGGAYAILDKGLLDIVAQHKKIAASKPVQAEVISAEIRPVFSKDKRKKVSTYKPLVTYTYRVSGKKYTCNKVTPIAKSGRRWAREVVRDYTPGKTVTAYYDPDEPGEAFLVRQYFFEPYGSCLAFVPFLAFGVFGAVVTWVEWFHRREPTQRADQWFELKPDMGTQARMIALISVTLLWHLFAAVICGHYFAVAARPFRLAPIVITAVYEVVGCVPLGYFLRLYVLRRMVGEARVFSDRAKFELGDTVAIHSEQIVGAGVQVKRTSVALVSQKEWSTGGRIGWHISRVHKQQARGPEDYYSREKGTITVAGEFVIPPDAEPTSPRNAGDPRYKWYFEVQTTIAQSPDYTRRFPFVVQKKDA